MHRTKRCANTKRCYISQTISDELEISTERGVRRIQKYEWGKLRRRGSIFRTRSTTRNVFIHGWNYKRSFDQLHVLARKYSYIILCNLPNDAFEHQINYFIDIDKEQFHIERKKGSRFLWLYTHYKKRHYVRKTGGKASLIY